MLVDKFGRKDVPKRSFELEERSDVDPHDEFDPESLGMEDWGDGFYVEAEAVVIERNDDQSIKRTIPLSEAEPHQLFPQHFDLNNNPIEENMPSRPAPTRMKEKTVHLMAGLLMTYYARFRPGELPYNPLYDGIPAEEALSSDFILQPGKTNAQLVHVSAPEVHEWLKRVLAKRAEIINTRTGAGGWSGDLQDLSVTLHKSR